MQRNSWRSSRAVAAVLAAAALALVASAPLALAAAETEAGFLSLYFTPEELQVFSATRSLKSVARVAENVAVVTAGDIELMNAHTVAEALYNVTGIEMAEFKGPGSGGTASVHGSGATRVTVLLDGVPLGTAGNDFSLSRLPVQMVRRIEVVKGPASSTWGSSFGGVVNVITKSFADGGRGGGMAYASYGEEDTSDLRAELRGGGGPFGFYLYGGTMRSDGVQDDHAFTHRDLFGKASLNAGAKARFDVTLYYGDGDSENMDFRPFGIDVYEGFDVETRYGKADFRTSLGGGADLSLSAWTLRQDDNFYQKRLSDDSPVRDAPTTYDRHGVRGDVTWRSGRHVAVAGADFLDGTFEHDFEPRLAIDQRTHGLFVNDTITVGSLCVTPGLRYDHSDLAGGLWSPSLGLTYLASRDLLFRGLVSRGFHDPSIVRYFDAPPLHYVGNPDLTPEIIWSYQVGLEANVADLLRTKVTLFYHDIDDILTEKLVSSAPGEPLTFTSENAGSARTVGGELELTARSRGFTFEGGASYEQVKQLDFTTLLEKSVRDLYGFNAAVSYDAGKGFRATVKGHYFWWDSVERLLPDSDGVIVDANLLQELLRRGGFTLDAFFTARNLFDQSSYADFVQQNPGRWVEAGVRCSF